MTRFAALLLLLCVPAHAVRAMVRGKHRKRKPAAADDRVFVGTPGSLILQNEAVDAMGLPRIRDDRQLQSLIAEDSLVPITQNEYVAVSPKLEAKRRYVKPFVDVFLQELGKEYHAEFGEPIQVNSAVRTVRTQISLMRWNRNAAPAHGEKASAHLAGVAVDLQRRGLTPGQIRFIQQRLSVFAQAKMILVEEELYNGSCFHVVVTGEYLCPPPEIPSPEIPLPEIPLPSPAPPVQTP
jgi:hypothetical protein